MRTVAITGAGNGIGRALAVHYAARNWQVIGVDIDPTGLAETERLARDSGAGFRALVADLCHKEDRRRLMELLRRRQGVDVFIHNAALNLVGAFDTLRFDDQRGLIELNLVAPMLLTRDLLTGNLLRPNASLVFMSSLSHFVGYPGAAVYSGTKDGLAHYARSLRMALKPRRIHVLTVYPGPSRTPMAERCSPAGAGRPETRMPPDELARRIAHAVERRRPVLIPGARNRLFATLGKWAPMLADAVMKAALFDRLDPERHPHGLGSRASRD